MKNERRFDLEQHLLRVRTATNVQAVLELAKQSYLELGAVRLSYHLTGKIRSQTNSDDLQLVSYGFPQSWIDKYSDPEFRMHDPIPDIIMEHGQPMLWSDALKVRKLTHEEQAFAAELESAGLIHGLGVPLFGRNLRNAYSSFGFDNDALAGDITIQTDIMAIATLSHLQVCNILEKPAEHEIRLSTRESQVIGLIARGCSTPIIADKMSVSETTVSTYVRRIFAKLEVNDKVSAVIRALEYGILRY